MGKIINNLKFKFSNRFSFYNNGNKYYYKKFDLPDRKLEYLYHEIIAYKMANLVGIECVKPTLISKQNMVGIITSSFDLDNYDKINGSMILKEYCTYLKENNLFEELYGKIDDLDTALSKLNNLEDIWNALEYHFRNYDSDLKNKFISQIMLGLTKTFSFDIITMQIDRHSDNWEILESKNKDDALLAPLYDNELAFTSFTYNGSLKTDSTIGDISTMIKNLKRYLTTSSVYFVNEFIDMFNKLNPEIFEQVLKECDSEYGHIIPYTYKNKLLETYIGNYENIKDVLIQLNLIEKSEEHAR